MCDYALANVADVFSHMILEYSIVDHFILRADDGVDLFACHHRVHIPPVTEDRTTRSHRRIIITLHDDPDSCHDMAAWTLLHLTVCRRVADFSVNLLGFVSTDQFRRGR